MSHLLHVYDKQQAVYILAIPVQPTGPPGVKGLSITRLQMCVLGFNIIPPSTNGQEPFVCWFCYIAVEQYIEPGAV